MAASRFDRHHSVDYSPAMAKPGHKRADKAKKDTTLRFRVTDEQFEEFEQAARIEHFDDDVTDWARRALLREARRIIAEGKS